MSILSQLLKKQITFGAAAKQVEAWGASIVAATPGAADAVAGAVSAVKQAASNAVAYSDTALQADLGAIETASTGAADAALQSLTGGHMPAGAITLLNGTIEQIEAAGAAAYHTWALAMKAKVAAQASPQQTLPLSSVTGGASNDTLEGGAA